MSVTLVTNLGDIKIELYNEQAPKACENFLALCASGYYNDSLFHRNIPGFMVQGGDDREVRTENAVANRAVLIWRWRAGHGRQVHLGRALQGRDWRSAAQQAVR